MVDSKYLFLTYYLSGSKTIKNKEIKFGVAALGFVAS